MTALQKHIVYIDDDGGEADLMDKFSGEDIGAPTGWICAHIHPASPEAVERVLGADPNSENGRSNWVWVRLQNGDLCLAIFIYAWQYSLKGIHT